MNYQTDITINGARIGLAHPVYFVADIAANHDGDLERAKDLIWKAKEAGADAAKFQHFKADKIVSDAKTVRAEDTAAKLWSDKK